MKNALEKLLLFIKKKQFFFLQKLLFFIKKIVVYLIAINVNEKFLNIVNF